MARKSTPAAVAEVAGERAALEAQVTLLQERISELELDLEGQGWWRMTTALQTEFSREGLRRIIALSRLMYLKSPLINRAVTLQSFYVWGQGVSVKAEHPDVDAVVQRFWDDPKNQVELTGHQARTLKEAELQTTGNLCFVCFTNRATGRVRLRTIDVDEITDIITNPEDRKDPWLYRREWTATTLAADGRQRTETHTAYYPDWRYHPTARPASVGGVPVMWDTPVYHVKVGGLPTMRFGVPETYQALDWARAYKEFLEDWHSIVKAYARFAWNLQVKGGRGAIAAAKSRLGTTQNAAAGTVESNPPPLPGSTFIAGEGATLTPVRTAGATTSAEDGRRSLLMVAAATGLPESFFGDVSVGTLATARSLDRPTELKFRDRQTLWADVLRDIIDYVIDRAALAPRGGLRGEQAPDEDGDPVVTLALDPETGEPMSRRVDIAFPPILEHSVSETVNAIVEAATLGGHPLAGTLDARSVTRLLLTALGVEQADELLDELFPEDGETTQPGQGEPAQEAFTEALRELRAAVAQLIEGQAAA